MIMNYHYQSDQVQSLTKTKQDNDVTYCTGVVYVENHTELSWPIKSGAVYD